MTKLLACSRCGCIRTLLPDRITTCECGTVKGWWADEARGVARLYTESTLARRFARFIGLHNTFLAQATAFEKPVSDSFHRMLHEHVGNTRGYLFDHTRRGCWAVVLIPGESTDT